MERKTYCPICGAESPAPAGRCGRCGSAPDLETSSAVKLDRVRRARAMARLVLLIALAWWAAALWRGLAPEGTLVPAAIALVGLAESVWMSSAEGKLRREHERELVEARARLKAAESAGAEGGGGSAPAAAPAGAAGPADLAGAPGGPQEAP